MPRFRKRPVVIEAVKWNGYSNRLGLTTSDPMIDESARYEKPDWLPPVTRVVDDAGNAYDVPAGEVWRMGESLWIGTLEGAHRADPGDWIIQGVKGEIYPCKPDIFSATYDPL